MSQPELLYPRDLRFSCTQCGDCCRTWNVPLAVGEPERLAAIDWSGRADELIGLTPAVKVKAAGTSRSKLARRPDGSCVYLGRDNDCLLHSHFGAAAKPLACSLYPFSFQALAADRLTVDAAFSCRAVSLAHGAPLADQASRLRKLATQLGTVRTRPRHRLTATREASAEVVWEIEHQLLSYLRDDSMRLLDRIRCSLEYLRLATSGDPATPTAALLRRTIAQAMPTQIMQRPLEAIALDDTQRAVLGLWTYLSLNPPLDLISLKPRQQRHEAEQRAALADAFRERRGRPMIADRELPMSFADIDGVSLIDLGSRADPVVASFFEAKIIGQRFRRSGDDEIPLVEGAERLFLSYPIALWAAKALAAERGSNQVQEVDLRGALRLLDRTLGEIRTAALAKRQQKAWNFVIGDTDLAVMAAAAMVGGS